MKNTKGDAGYEITKEFSCYGRYTADATKPYEVGDWLKVTLNNTGTDVSSVATSTTYATGLYGGDYFLMGTAVRPFLGRSGAWNAGAGTGVFYFGGADGDAFSTTGFRPVVVL